MKKYYQITSLALGALDKASFSQLIEDSLDVLDQYVKQDQSDSFLVAQASSLRKLLVAYESGTAPKIVTQTAQLLEEADTERDDALSTLFKMIRAFSKVKNPETQAAYATLSKIVDAHKIDVRVSYEKETANIDQLLNTLSDETIQQALEQLHLTSHLVSLIDAQASFKQTYQQRVAEQKGQQPTNTKGMRLDLQEAYNLVIDYVVVNSVAYPERADLVDLRQGLNALRGRYNKRKTTKKADGNEVETTE